MKKAKRCLHCGATEKGVKTFCTACQTVDIEEFGDYRMGLTNEEIVELIGRRINNVKVPKQTVKNFWKIAGCNTCPMTSKGIPLMYRHDVVRFMSNLLYGTPTYFD